MADQTGSGPPEHGSVGLIDGKQNYKRNQQEPNQRPPCTGRIWMILTVIFIITTIAAVAVLLWRELGVHRKTTERDIITLFPNYFRTPAEQKVYAERVREIERQHIVYTNTTVYIREKQCSFNCTFLPQRAKRETSASVTYNGCCLSETKFISPDSLENVIGQEQTIVQFQNKRQFFQTEECSQMEFCYGCNCAQTVKFVTAVVENEASTSDDDKFMLDMVKIPGCCKCINVGQGRRKRSNLENIVLKTMKNHWQWT